MADCDGRLRTVRVDNVTAKDTKQENLADRLSPLSLEQQQQKKPHQSPLPDRRRVAALPPALQLRLRGPPREPSLRVRRGRDGAALPQVRHEPPGLLGSEGRKQGRARRPRRAGPGRGRRRPLTTSGSSSSSTITTTTAASSRRPTVPSTARLPLTLGRYGGGGSGAPYTPDGDRGVGVGNGAQRRRRAAPVRLRRLRPGQAGRERASELFDLLLLGAAGPAPKPYQNPPSSSSSAAALSAAASAAAASSPVAAAAAAAASAALQQLRSESGSLGLGPIGGGGGGAAVAARRDWPSYR